MREKYHVRQLIEVALAVIVVTALIHVLDHGLFSQLVLVAAVPFLLYARRITKLGEPALAFKMLVVTLSLVATLLTWGRGGLSDPAVLSYPAILLLFSLIGSRGLLIAAFVFFAFSLSLLFTLQRMGIHSVGGGTQQVLDLVSILIVLAGTTGIVLSVQGTAGNAVARLYASHAAVVQSEKQVEFLAHHDILTGLPTRTLARDRFEIMMRAAARRGGNCSILFLNLDNFRLINEQMGHQAGDQFLIHVARLLRHAVGPENAVCRQSGDEFLILVSNADVNEKITGIMNAVIEEMKTPVTISGTLLSCSCSIGVAIYPADGATYDEVFKHADAAMSMAKDAGRNAFQFYDQKLNSREKKSFHMITSLRQAISSGELVLYYQPQFELRTGKMIGAEALVRWVHSTEGLLSPAAFIHLAENSGLINELGNWVLYEACRQGAEWLRSGHDLVVSINTSPIQFRRKDMIDNIVAALKQTGLPPKNLDIELTEGLFLEDTQETADNLRRIRELGVNMSIDDFGTGYSNLAYLPRLPVQQLKIDQSFIRNMTPDNHKLVLSMVQIARNFNLATMAEGVEDATTLDRLIELGCSRGQGYLWDGPLPANVFKAKYLQPNTMFESA
jgi:diguanylate cyclase